MTFDEIVVEAADRLNLTSDAALERLGRYVNSRYRRVTSAIGLQTSRRVDVELDLDGSVVGSPPAAVLPELRIPEIEKVLKVTMDLGATGVRTLDELTYDDITDRPTRSALPRAWAPKKMLANSVIITLDAFPDAEFSVRVYGYAQADVLADDAEPAFSESHHDVLVEGAIADELRKMEKPALAAIAEQIYNERLSDLKMFIAKSAYLEQFQGKNKPNYPWSYPWGQRFFGNG